jgi:hypothetical protein
MEAKWLRRLVAGFNGHVRRNEGPAKKELEITKIWEFSIGTHGPSPAVSASSCCTANTMNKRSGLRREVKVDDVL